MRSHSLFNPNAVSHPRNNIFGLPLREEDAQVVLLPVPWAVTCSYDTGTARAPGNIMRESHKVELLDADVEGGWKKGFFMREIDKKVLLKSDYLRKEAELFINYVVEGGNVPDNKFMAKSLDEINEGSAFLNDWVYRQAGPLLAKGKRVGLVGGDHSICLGLLKALAEQEGDFGVLHINAHAALRKEHLQFIYSHTSVMRSALEDIPEIRKLVQLGVRDYCEAELAYATAHSDRIISFYDKRIKERLYEGQTWQQLADEIILALPDKVYVSFNIDGLDARYCPNTCTPVAGGLDLPEVFYLFKRLVASGRSLLGFDLTDVGTSQKGWDENVAARILFKLCNLMVKE